MALAKTFDATDDQIKAANERVTIVVQTLAAAIQACLDGLVIVGNSVQWREREPSSSIGGDIAILRDAGSSVARPSEDGGAVIWVGDEGLYLWSPKKIANLEKFGAETLTQATFNAITASIFYMKCDTELNLSEKITIYGDGLTIDLRKFKVTSSLTSGEAIVISGNNNALWINYDGQERPVTPVRITGQGNEVRGSLRKVQAQAGMTNTHLACVDDRGGNNSNIAVKCYDITNVGYTTNGSFPHCVSLQDSSKDAQVRLIGENIIAGIIASVCASPVIHECIINGAVDNGVYILEGATGVALKYLRYRGSEEPFVDKGDGTDVEVADVVNIQAPFGFQNSKNCTIKEVNLIYDDLAAVKAKMSAIFQTRSGNVLTSGLKIGKVNGRTYGNRIFGFDTGECKDFTIRNCDITHVYHDPAQAKSIFSQAGTNTGFYDISNCNFRIVDETGGLTSSDSFTFQMPNGITKLSKWHNNELDCDGSFKIYVNNIGIAKVSIRGAVMETSFGPRLRENGYTNFCKKIVRTTAVPTKGYWDQGDRVELVNTSVGGTKVAYCTTAGDFADTAPVFEQRT